MGDGPIDLVGVVEGLYRIDLPRDEWLAGATVLLRPLLDRHGLGILANFYECQDPCSYVPYRSVVHDVPFALAKRYFAYASQPHPTFIADSVLSRRCYFCCRIPRGSDIRSVIAEIREEGAVDKLTLNTVEPDGSGCCFGSFQGDASPLSARASVALTRVAGHLGAAYRLRRRFESTGVSSAAASAVMAPNGSVHHAVGDASGRRERERLGAAARAMDRARSRPRRNDSLKAIQEWKALVGRRWILLDHVERDGRRFVLAVESKPAVDPIDLLSPRERDVIRAVLRGQTYKAIAHELSLAVSTVRVLIARASAKLRARSRADLLDKAAVLAPQPERRAQRAEGASDDRLGGSLQPLATNRGSRVMQANPRDPHERGAPAYKRNAH
ncbi:MAG TPA: helix-turn-helix transcriptional regulator [Polyangiaceae bacterium]|nr:helix-turn-helix transcriptional regulator [Polyangiaceae bacterium]